VNQAAAHAVQNALIAASGNSEERATAVSALRGASLWAATWPTDPATLRTLTNSSGVTALAVFTDEEQLHDAAMRYGWLGLDGRVPSKLLHISEAMRFAKLNRAKVVVVDIASEHALELDEGEMDLLASPPSGRPPSYSGMPPVRTSRPPAEDGSPALSLSQLALSATRAPSHQSLEAVSVTHSQAPASESGLELDVQAPAGARSISQTQLSAVPGAGQSEPPTSISVSFGASGTAQLLSMPALPSEEVVDAFTAVLRDYPEVEWACLVRASRGPGEPVPSVGLRIDAAFRKNLNEISVKLREAGIANGSAFDMLLLDTPEQMKAARQIGRPFYPWRKKG
jgi:hypothetical protein